jgi:hypothetical protein
LSTDSLKLSSKHRDTGVQGPYLKLANKAACAKNNAKGKGKHKMPTTAELMRHLNNAEKRAVRAHRILTHAFVTSRESFCLKMRYKSLDELPNNGKAREAAVRIESENWARWIKEAEKAGLR